MSGTGRDRIRIGNGAGSWGDNLDAPIRLVEKGGLDYLTLDYLAESTLTMLVNQRKRKASAGYVEDFLTVLPRLIACLQSQPGLRIITNAGGFNPASCAGEAAKLLRKADAGQVRVAWVEGDDLMPRLEELRLAGETLPHFESLAASDSIRPKLVCANAYLGAAAITKALESGARIVITGRIADTSLTVGPSVYEFGWDWRDWDRLATAATAGRLIGCGAQVTGGLLSRWETVKDYASIGYPIAELNSAGGCMITKPAGTGGRVDCDSVVEQLLHEIGDPACYPTPDVTLDFTGLELEAMGKDAVLFKGAKGRPPPDHFKVTCTYSDGFMARGDLTVCGRDAVKKAEACGTIILDRLAMSGCMPEKHLVEVLGTGACLPGVAIDRESLWEVGLRVSVWDPRQEAVDRFCREITPLITAGPPGIIGYADSRPRSRPVLSCWPSRVLHKNVTGAARFAAPGDLE